jgi:transposase
VADCTQAEQLIDGFEADALLGDKAYDTEAIVTGAERRGMIPIIPPKKNRRTRRQYDKYVYKMRHVVENAFLHLKRWRGIATRYAKRASSFLAIVQIRCIVLWGSIL